MADDASLIHPIASAQELTLFRAGRTVRALVCFADLRKVDMGLLTYLFEICLAIRTIEERRVVGHGCAGFGLNGEAERLEDQTYRLLCIGPVRGSRIPGRRNRFGDIHDIANLFEWKKSLRILFGAVDVAVYQAKGVH